MDKVSLKVERVFVFMCLLFWSIFMNFLYSVLFVVVFIKLFFVI